MIIIEGKKNQSGQVVIKVSKVPWVRGLDIALHKRWISTLCPLSLPHDCQVPIVELINLISIIISSVISDYDLQYKNIEKGQIIWATFWYLVELKWLLSTDIIINFNESRNFRVMINSITMKSQRVFPKFCVIWRKNRK